MKALTLKFLVFGMAITVAALFLTSELIGLMTILILKKKRIGRMFRFPQVICLPLHLLALLTLTRSVSLWRVKLPVNIDGTICSKATMEPLSRN